MIAIRRFLNCTPYVDEILSHSMPRTKKPPSEETLEEEPRIGVHSFTLTPDVIDALKQLSRDATDFLGRMVSSSAVVRALVHQAMRRGSPGAYELFPEVEKELDAGVM
jgi:hypothetical protein